MDGLQADACGPHFKETIMSVNSDYYRARADNDMAEAARTSLEMVRDRLLRSAAAWHAMADQLGRAERHRVQLAEEKVRQGIQAP